MLTFDKKTGEMFDAGDKVAGDKKLSVPSNIIGTVARDILNTENNWPTSSVSVLNRAMRKAAAPVNEKLAAIGSPTIPERVSEKTGRVSFPKLDRAAINEKVGFTEQSLLKAARKVK